MPIRAAHTSVMRVHPDGTSSRRASEIRRSIEELMHSHPSVRLWPADATSHPEVEMDRLLSELNVALRWEYA